MNAPAKRTKKPAQVVTEPRPSCPQCESENIQYYDGCLGYEAVRCHDCHTETDLNNPHNNGPFACTCKAAQ